MSGPVLVISMQANGALQLNVGRSIEFWQIELRRYTHSGVDHPLLCNGQNVVGDPVKHQARWEKEEHDAEHQGHDPHQLGLDWVWWRGIEPGLQHGGCRHQQGQNIEGVFG